MQQSISPFPSSPEASWYSLTSDTELKVQRWMVSTEESRRICNEPLFLGVDFSRGLQAAITKAMKVAPFINDLRKLDPCKLCTVNFLRGSLNFGLREALRDAAGSNTHATCFMSSQRFRVDGRWHVKEDMYRKLDIPQGAYLVLGDVVATGVTVDNGLQVMYDVMQEKGIKPAGLVFFTIGCHKIEKILERWHALFSKDNPGYKGTHVVYLEGKFRLVDSKTPLQIALQGTDLVKLGAILTPEYALSLYDNPAYVLERCAIYDAGSRAFDVPAYLEDVQGYWVQVAAMAKRGFTLKEALKERWSEEGFETWESFQALADLFWKGVSEEVRRQIYTAYQARWNAQFLTESESPKALLNIANARLHAIQHNCPFHCTEAP
jgi:hypothetical protein